MGFGVPGSRFGVQGARFMGPGLGLERETSVVQVYRGTSLITNNPLLGPYRRTILRVLRWA